MRTAFKEWAIVVEALGSGHQIVVLRKGGIHEGRNGFALDHREFFFFPTQFHQQRAAVLPAAQRRFDALAPALVDHAVVRLEFAARVEAWHRLESLADADRLRGQHIWRDDVVAGRFNWGRDPAIYAFAVRVLRLPRAVEIPLRPEYGGCKSWIELGEDVPLEGARPVLSDAEFAARLERFHTALTAAGTALV